MFRFCGVIIFRFVFKVGIIAISKYIYFLKENFLNARYIYVVILFNSLILLLFFLFFSLAKLEIEFTYLLFISSMSE